MPERCILCAFICFIREIWWHGNVNKYKQAFKIGFVYLQKVWSLDFLHNLYATSM